MDLLLKKSDTKDYTFYHSIYMTSQTGKSNLWHEARMLLRGDKREPSGELEIFYLDLGDGDIDVHL